MSPEWTEDPAVDKAHTPRQTLEAHVSDEADEAARLGGAVYSAAETGVERDLLVALRRRLSAALDDPRTQPRDLSAITARLREVSRDLLALDTAEGGDEIGEAVAIPDEPFDPSSI